MNVRVDELEIGEIYRVYKDDDRMIPMVVAGQHGDDMFLKFGHTTLQFKVLDEQAIMEPLVYIGTKPSRLYTHEPVEATHVFAALSGDKYCVQGRQIKYIIPFTP